MARASLALRLRDMLDTLEHLERQTAGRTLADYRQDRVLRDVVERSIERISEASRHIPDDMKLAAPEIPWREVANIGNVLRHGYLDTTTSRSGWSSTGNWRLRKRRLSIFSRSGGRERRTPARVTPANACAIA
jgi:uncharacterized protein with HEPN domain